MTWLLVEDDPDIRNVVAVMMQLWGERALALADGNAAWTWLDSVSAGTFKGDLPDLALMDIRMPGHTGDQIAARIRETERLKHIPIVLMTAFTLTDGEVQSMMARSGVDHLIKKPLPDMDIFKMTLYQVRDAKRKQASALKAPVPTPAISAPLPAIAIAPTPLAAPALPKPVGAESAVASPVAPPVEVVKPLETAKPTVAVQPATPPAAPTEPPKS